MLWFLCLFTLTLMATDAQIEAKLLGAENNFNSAMEKAKEEKKILLLLVVTDNCRWCQKMVHKTLRNNIVHEKLNNTIVLVLDKNDEMPFEFKSELYPSTYFINPETQKSVWENVGYADKEVFLKDVATANSMIHLH